jgi:hypothetical protein
LSNVVHPVPRPVPPRRSTPFVTSSWLVGTLDPIHGLRLAVTHGNMLILLAQYTQTAAGSLLAQVLQIHPNLKQYNQYIRIKTGFNPISEPERRPM